MKVITCDPEHITRKSHARRAELYRGLYGLYSRIARREGVHPSLVSRVARGHKRSRRIELALAREFRRIERLDKKSA